jgi:hypothetical protein
MHCGPMLAVATQITMASLVIHGSIVNASRRAAVGVVCPVFLQSLQAALAKKQRRNSPCYLTSKGSFDVVTWRTLGPTFGRRAVEVSYSKKSKIFLRKAPFLDAEHTVRCDSARHGPRNPAWLRSGTKAASAASSVWVGRFDPGVPNSLSNKSHRES